MTHAFDSCALSDGLTHQAAHKGVRVQILVLGSFRVTVDGRSIPDSGWRRQKARQLFKCLLCRPQHRLLKEEATEFFWPESDPDAASTNLRTTVHALRRALAPIGDQLIVEDRATYSLAPDPAIWIDADEFLVTIERAQTAPESVSLLEYADSLYVGDFLPDDVYEDWASERRNQLKHTWRELQFTLARFADERHMPGRAVVALERLVETDACDELAAQELMRHYSQHRERTAALRVYQHLVLALTQELGVEPSCVTTDLHRQIASMEVAPLPDGPMYNTPLRTLRRRRFNYDSGPTDNLPSELSTFVGRVHETERLLNLLGHSRLVTLAGAGGVGKTRLALRVATAVRELYPDGVWLVELASVTIPDLVPYTLAAVLDIPEQAGTPLLSTLTNHLAEMCMLLVLDNCEHVIEVCAHLCERLLRSCPRLQVLTTSREPLAIFGETIWRVPPLSVPTADTNHPIARLNEYESVQLFVERATSVRSDFQLTAENAEALGEVCWRLDGVPLALELAAARVSALSVQQIAGRLGDQFDLLEQGSRTAAPRHTTLRSVLDWSYDLLTERERILFESLAVFVGGWTLDAAEAVCRSDAIESRAVLSLLSRLVNKSLVTLDSGTNGETRYRLLETVRQYAGEGLASRGATELIRQQHAAYFTQLAERGDPEHYMAYGRAWLDRMELEHDNIRAAIKWCLESEAIDVSLRLCRSVVQFWYVRGYLKEAWSWIERVLEMARGAAPTIVQVDLLTLTGGVLRAQPSYARAHTCFREALGLARELGYAQGESAALDGLGVLASQSGQFELARAYYQEALRQAEGHPLETSAVLIDLGDLAYADNLLDTAQSCYERSQSLQRAIANHHGLAVSLARLAKVALVRGDCTRARALCDESIAIREELGGRLVAVISRLVLSQVALAEGKATEAWQLAEECLHTFCDLGRTRDATVALSICGALLARSDHFEGALQLFAAAARQRAAIGYVPPSSELAWLQPWEARSRGSIPEELAATAWARGLGMNMEEAVAQVTAMRTEFDDAARMPSEEVTLTPREREIAALIGRGCSNRQIAETLVIARSTAEHHVANILAKLDLRTRGQVAVWALTRGLLGQSSEDMAAGDSGRR